MSGKNVLPKRSDVLDFILKELTKKEILSLYKRFLIKFFGGTDGGVLVSEAAVRWLIARNLCSCYGLYDYKKHLICFGLFINDIEKRVMLLDYFVVLKKYRGYNYPEIFFEMLVEMYMHEEEKTDSTGNVLGIFIELEGACNMSVKALDKRQAELGFYRDLGAYITDIIPEFSDEEYNILFLPINARLTRTELKAEILNIYKEILPSFNDKRKYIKRLTEEVDGLI